MSARARVVRWRHLEAVDIAIVISIVVGVVSIIAVLLLFTLKRNMKIGRGLKFGGTIPYSLSRSSAEDAGRFPDAWAGQVAEAVRSYLQA